MSKLNSTTYKMNYTLKSNGVYCMYVFPNSSFENQCNPHPYAKKQKSHDHIDKEKALKISNIHDKNYQ